jgi:hypothetical protein
MAVLSAQKYYVPQMTHVFKTSNILSLAEKKIYLYKYIKAHIKSKTSLGQIRRPG